MNDIYNNYGEKLSFYQLINQKKWKVEIPIIQRDYVQGRDSVKEIRVEFLNTLFNHLDTSKNIDLDFVYGSIYSLGGEPLFIPLDGQQRLTTLFLLHWYLSLKDNQKESFDSFMVLNGNSNFTYETRTSSSDFCNALVKHDARLNSKECCLSEDIKDCKWYINSWDFDPTVHGMLNMLDAIHEIFYSSEGFYQKLIDEKEPIITFQFLNLENFQLNDDLYIKMNSRGKQLSFFENFKAKIEQFIAVKDFGNTKYCLDFSTEKREVSVKKYFSHKIDTTWIDFFWNFKKTFSLTNSVDELVMSFYRTIITNHFALKNNTDKAVDNLQKLIGRTSSDRNITFLTYHDMGCIDEKLIIDLINITDMIINPEGNSFREYLIPEDKFYYNEIEIFKLTLNNFDNKVGYRDKLRFYALYSFLQKDQSKSNLSDWMRIVYNLTENFIYDRPEQFINSIKSIEKLLCHSNNILEFFANKRIDIFGFASYQILEERLKASLILKSQEWRDAIIEIEKHGYFAGQIDFLLDFSGIKKYYNENNNTAWNIHEDKRYFDSFIHYSSLAKSIFSDKGLNIFPDFLWERALLSKGDYLLKKNSNYSFLINDDRDISWKRLLRDDKRKLVKELFDDQMFSSSNISNSLLSIIEKSDPRDWKEPFIKNHEIIKYLNPNKKYIRWNNQHEIYLLEKQRLSAKHAELYSYSFYVNYLMGKTFQPFQKSDYYSAPGYEVSCAFLDNWVYEDSEYAIDIFYDAEQRSYGLRFFSRNNEISDIIISALKKINFELSNIYDDKSYIYYDKNRVSLFNFLVAICISFNKLNHEKT